LEFGGESFYAIFFRENGKEECTLTIPKGIFAAIVFHLLLEVESWG